MFKPGKIRCMLEISSANVGTEHMSEIDKKITPILVELTTLDPENYEHPSIKELFNWLVAPGRAGKEFYYIVGTLQEYVLKVMKDHFRQYVDPLVDCFGYTHLGPIATEALAMICPILEGSWEQVAWVLLALSPRYTSEVDGVASDRLTAWLIHVIGDPVMCPNPYLRIELLHLLQILVDFKLQTRKSLQPQAVESVLFACSYLNKEYLLESKPQLGYYHKMNIDYIVDALNDITIDTAEEIDEEIFKKLQNVKSLRLSVQIHDVAYHYAGNPNKFAEPRVFKGLTTILKIIDYYLHLDYRDYQDKTHSSFSYETGTNNTTEILRTFINIFKKSCWTPHLIGLIATCILTTIDIVMSEYAITEYIINESRGSFICIIKMLEDLFDENINNPDIEYPENMIILDVYKERLNNIKMHCG